MFLVSQSSRRQSKKHCPRQKPVRDMRRDGRDGLFAEGIVLGALIGADQIPRVDTKDTAGRLKIFRV